MCFSLKDGDSSNFDAVILTQPTPQILDMVGAAGVPSDVIAELGNVEYSSRFALAVYYDGDNIGYDSMLEGVNAKYISGEPIVRFVALGNLKTDGKSSPGSKLSVVVHTSGPFGTDNLEASKEEMGPVMEVRKWMIRVSIGNSACLIFLSLLSLEKVARTIPDLASERRLEATQMAIFASLETLHGIARLHFSQ